jgi:osmotically-inducible protein OsmY
MADGNGWHGGRSRRWEEDRYLNRGPSQRGDNEGNDGLEGYGRSAPTDHAWRAPNEGERADYRGSAGIPRRESAGDSGGWFEDGQDRRYRQGPGYSSYGDADRDSYGRGRGPSSEFGGYGGEFGGRGTPGRGYDGPGGFARSGLRPEGEERGLWDRTRDEVSSWFGDDQAERRRELDAWQAGQHRGRGPRGYTRSDQRIHEDINDRLTEDSFVDASDIAVTVSAGEATLDGFVDSRREKRRAEDLAEQVSGVKHVQNNLRVQQAPSSSSGMAGGTSAGSGGASTGAAGSKATAGASSAGSGMGYTSTEETKTTGKPNTAPT